MPAFSRNTPIGGHSLARWRYRREQQEPNNFYWVSVVRNLLSAQELSGAGMIGPWALNLGLTHDAAGLPISERIPGTVEETRAVAIKNETMVRNFTLMMAVAAYERYLEAVASLACQSDPLRVPGWPKKADGLFFLREKISLDVPNLRGLTEGDHSSRQALYQRLFREVPPSIADAKGELERIRKHRNAVAHDLGFEPSVSMSLSMQLLISSRLHRGTERPLSEKRLVKWIRLLSSAVVAIDNHLCLQYIGDYEFASLYISWSQDPEAFRKTLNATSGANWRNDKKRAFLAIMRESTQFRQVDSMYISTMDRFIVSL